MRQNNFALLISIAIALLAIAGPVHTATSTMSKGFKAKIIELTEDTVVAIDRNNVRYHIARNEQGDHPGIEPGQSVIVNSIDNDSGKTTYVISDMVRTTSLWILFIVFIAVLLCVNNRHGVKSLINTLITLAILIFGIVPLILKGFSPVMATIAGGIASMLWNLYFSHGWNRKSHASLIGIALCLCIAGMLSAIFVKMAHLSGLVQEEAVYLQAIGFENINMQGLLLAAIIIGVLGVLDDLAINQVSVIEELKKTNPNMSQKKLVISALKIGRDHTGAIVNTLLFAYAGASFPLLLMVTIHQAPFDSLFGILNNEIIATEIIRTLIGTICIVLAMPITTFVAIRFYKKN